MRVSSKSKRVRALVAASSFGVMLLAAPSAGAVDFNNTTAINIPNAAGSADTYPSSVTISGVSGTVTKARVRFGIHSEGSFGGANVLLVGPNGQSVMLMSETCKGGVNDFSAHFLFDDAALTSLSGDVGALCGDPEVTAKPTDNTAGNDSFALPAPGGTVFGTSLAVFNGISPNGTWSLFANSDAVGTNRALPNGWTLQLDISNPSNVGFGGAASQVAPAAVPATACRPTVKKRKKKKKRHAVATVAKKKKKKKKKPTCGPRKKRKKKKRR